MSQWNFDELNKALERSGWNVICELPGDGNSFSAYWRIQRYGKSAIFHITFYGLHESGALPIEKAYACYLSEDETIELGFRHRSRKRPEFNNIWQQELQSFVEKVNSYAAA